MNFNLSSNLSGMVPTPHTAMQKVVFTTVYKHPMQALLRHVTRRACMT